MNEGNFGHGRGVWRCFGKRGLKVRFKTCVGYLFGMFGGRALAGKNDFGIWDCLGNGSKWFEMGFRLFRFWFWV